MPRDEDPHLRRGIQHLGHVHLLDQEVRILERRLERRVERVEIRCHHVNRADQVNDAAFAGRFPGKGSCIRGMRDREERNRDRRDAQREHAAPDRLEWALRHMPSVLCARGSARRTLKTELKCTRRH